MNIRRSNYSRTVCRLATVMKAITCASLSQLSELLMLSFLSFHRFFWGFCLMCVHMGTWLTAAILVFGLFQHSRGTFGVKAAHTEMSWGKTFPKQTLRQAQGPINPDYKSWPGADWCKIITAFLGGLMENKKVFIC